MSARPPAGAAPPSDFTQSFDARDWAAAFVGRVKANPSIATDEGAMIGWFANAIMRGHDEPARRAPVAEPPQDGVADAARECIDEAAFALVWNGGEYKVSKPNIGTMEVVPLGVVTEVMDAIFRRTSAGLPPSAPTWFEINEAIVRFRQFVPSGPSVGEAIAALLADFVDRRGAARPAAAPPEGQQP